ncbi:MAG: hypothetical protein BWK80_16705 [Desulfobacteraceae bacterium IS3]|nr:MAG: hypothetical protein BWK80_16705 [Desulfobacteraceae bacterium IS3]HAO19541.1 hypothetical protein [Desulfobacteraceae bacterium]
MSLKPQTASEISSFADELNHFLLTWDFSDFDLKRLKKKAENIKKNVDLADGFSLLGMIGCLENDTESMRSYFKRAIDQSGGDHLHIFNYAVCLGYLGLYEEAYEQALKAYEKSRLDQECLDILVKFTCILNKKDAFEKYARAWHKLTRKDHWSKISPFFFPIKQEDYHAFLKKYSKSEDLPEGHLLPIDILDACGPAIARIFGTPISVVLEIMPNSSYEPNLVAFVQWFGDMEEGMKREELFEEWYIENNYDLKTDLIIFSIEFVGE